MPFLLNILRWLLVAIPATWTSSWLSYVESKLALAYRTRLTQEVMKQYLGNEHDPQDVKVFYKLGELRTPLCCSIYLHTNGPQLTWTIASRILTSKHYSTYSKPMS